MLILNNNLEEVIKLNTIESDFSETKEYIRSIFIKYIKYNLNDFNTSYTIKYANASLDNKFDKFQELADELLFINSLYPESLNGASISYYQGIGKTSYHRCHRMLNGQWPLFEELADKFDYFTSAIRSNLPINQYLFEF